MQSSGAASTDATGTRDIIFNCAHCSSSLVVDAAAAGLTVPCQSCGQPTPVPHPAFDEAAASALKISELQHQLRENESQRTEITSYINQHSIQLHRWQLRLKSLIERQQKLESELATMCEPSTR
jgi:transcription elongation factor Elf1